MFFYDDESGEKEKYVSEVLKCTIFMILILQKLRHISWYTYILYASQRKTPKDNHMAMRKGYKPKLLKRPHR